jgi:hypothetical protein
MICKRSFLMKTVERSGPTNTVAGSISSLAERLILRSIYRESIRCLKSHQ